MAHFLGEYEVTLDAKGRFLLPAGFKKQLPEEELRFVINRGFEKCLTLYPVQTWKPLHAKISELNEFDPKVRSFRRQFLGGATEVEADTAGRLLLPPTLRDFAGLSKDIILAAAVDKIEIWDAAVYKKLFEEFSPEAFSDLAQEVMVKPDNKMNNPSQAYHVPVLYTESLDALQIKSDGVYVDCTFGGGGHSRGILERLGKEGKLIAFDQDADAQKNLPEDERIIFIPQNFMHLQRFLRLHKYPQVDGVLADLGVSSHQFDEGERGFSIRFDGPLDMRMDRRSEHTASEILANATEKELVNIFSLYGEVSNSKTLAKFITDNRNAAALSTVQSFKNMIAPVVKGNPNKYLAQVFQALRIQVNDEMNVLKSLLEQLPEVLIAGGRAAIITFHSLEDRLVKNFFKQGSFEAEEEHPFFNSERVKPFKVITKKPILPSEKELKENGRSRSAKLRVAERN